MDQGFDFQPATKRQAKSPYRPILIAVGAAFLLGGASMYALAQSELFSGLINVREDAGEVAAESDTPALPAAGATAEPTAEPTTPVEEAAQEARQAAEQVEQVVEQQGGLDSRIAAMEQRLTRLDLQSQAAAGNAARAEALLIAFASRRALERGAPLGYLADQLRLRFGENRPNAVQTVIDAAQEPVTLDQLLARLEGLAPQLDDAPEGEDVFTRLGRELSEVFVVRREDTASPVAERRLERARLFLQSGRIEAAISEIRNMPNAVIAREWIDDAERFAAAQRALETLETAAVLDPRELRDGEGSRVEQRSPAGNSRN
ncbi:hypothetical protein [Aurantiacibacter sediminis]|uniref:Inner membrane protein n=1 Tax=Aurantiacibacter sediminis TaxID=2793064 RepID=A0ABS0N244_9SPHN|nr:hypothetical protein [Aurantiacibacter sediminis]MBH5322033.1 hypothetical protein [Aurantiacibacter sediminis]